jgi:hypothetical protein
MHVHTHVAVSGVEVLVSEQLRDLTQVYAGAQKLGDKDVPERVRRYVLALRHVGSARCGRRGKPGYVLTQPLSPVGDWSRCPRHLAATAGPTDPAEGAGAAVCTREGGDLEELTVEFEARADDVCAAEP